MSDRESIGYRGSRALDRQIWRRLILPFIPGTLQPRQKAAACFPPPPPHHLVQPPNNTLMTCARQRVRPPRVAAVTQTHKYHHQVRHLLFHYGRAAIKLDQIGNKDLIETKKKKHTAFPARVKSKWTQPMYCRASKCSVTEALIGPQPRTGGGGTACFPQPTKSRRF